MKAFVETVVKGLVDDPSAVEVSSSEKGEMTVFSVRVAPEDIGRIVGKNGSTINAIRALLTAGASRKGLRCTLDLDEN